MTRTTNHQILTASSLDPPQAIALLIEIQTRGEKIKSDLGAPGVPFLETPAGVYLNYHKFDRWVKMLQIVEAIRHETAIHEGKLPESLAAIDSVPIPNDPMTGTPFIYVQDNGIARLRTPDVQGLDKSMQRSVSKSYTIRIVK